MCACACVRVYMRACVHMRTRVCVCLCVRACVRVCSIMYALVNMNDIHTYIHTYIYG